MNVVADTDLLFPGLHPPLGWPVGMHRNSPPNSPAKSDPLRYVVWVDPGRWHPGNGSAGLGRGQGSSAGSLPELAPRIALHLVVCRNGAGP